MRNVLIAMICIVMFATLFGCIRQSVAPDPPTFSDDGNGVYVAAVRKECTMSIYDALVKDLSWPRNSLCRTCKTLWRSAWWGKVCVQSE